MNRFVIIGNGFDLAHEFKTSYGDFLYDLIIRHLKCIMKSKSDKIYTSEDKLIEVILNSSYRRLLDEDFLKNFEKIDNIIDSDKIKWIKSFPFKKSETHFGEMFQISFKSKFLSELLIDKKWADIEKTYFEELLNVFKKFNPYDKAQLKDDIKNLNNEFNILKNEIIIYLKKVDEDYISSKRNFFDFMINKDFIFDKLESELDEKYINRYFSEIYFKEVYLKNKEKKIPNKPKLLKIIDFNYTNTIQKYIISKLNHSYYEHHHIHGKIHNSDSIIFGYGDDSHASYQELEDFDEEELLKNIKSFYYPNQKCYLDIINALEVDEFDVFVIGHSLGLSDRVLLSSIFEHKNCRAIKLFHRGTKENQFKKRIALSRHFKDKALMRKRIVDYDESDWFK